MIKKCAICGAEFETKYSRAKYCSKKCGVKAENNTERAKLARKEWLEKNKERKRQKDKETRDNYTDERKREIKEKNHQYYLLNKNKILDNSKRWKIENQEYYKEYCRQYSKEYNMSENGKYINRLKVHRRRAIEDSLDKIDYRAVKDKFDRLGNKCVICGSTENITIDHIVPITKGGTNDIDNLQPLCKSCNSSKNNKTMEEFLRYIETKNEKKRAG